MTFSDIHSHFVYGMDDGAQTRREMEAMLDAAWADGVAEMVATPHMVPGLQPFDADNLYTRLSEARGYCQARGYAMRLYTGAEILYTPALASYVGNHPLPTIADTRYVLLEFAPSIAYSEIAGAVDMLDQNGYTPIIAHVERYKSFTGLNPYRLKERSSVLYQVNCGTVIDGVGLLRNMQVYRWFRDSLVDHIASDSHNIRFRKTRMRNAYDVLSKRYGAEYAGHLVRTIQDM